MAIKGGESLAVKAGKAAGEAAEETVLKVAAKTEQRLAAGAAKTEGAAAPEASAAAREATERAAAKAGANAEVKATQTVTGMGQAGGVAVGGAVANQATGEDGYVQNSKEAAQAAVNTVRDTDRAVMEVVDDLTGQNEPQPSSSRVSSGQIKYPPAEPGSSSSTNGGEERLAAGAEKTEGAAANTGQTPASK